MARIARFVAPGLPHNITQHGKIANFTTISSPCNAATMMPAARHVALNPVRARLAARPWDWRWSGVRAHLAARDDALRPSRRSSSDANSSAWPRTKRSPRGAKTIGRPLGLPAFLDRITALTECGPRPRKLGPKPGVNTGFGNVSPNPPKGRSWRKVPVAPSAAFWGIPSVGGANGNARFGSKPRPGRRLRRASQRRAAIALQRAFLAAKPLAAISPSAVRPSS